MPRVADTIADLRRAVAELRSDREARGLRARVGFVATMGALHDGHLSLVRRARDISDIVVVSIFVNPLQFGPNEDLSRYPRDRDADLALLDGEADLVFAPSVEEMYPDGPVETLVTAGPVGSLYEGASRPGHFTGMLTVVAKLFSIVGPDVSVFGQKDAQQVFLVGRMVRDLNLPLAIVEADTVREHDGMALSSRNRFLGEAARPAARALSEALAAGARVASDGVDAVRAAALAVLEQRPDVKLDYLVVVDPETFLPVTSHPGAALLLVAAWVDEVRLIDNARILLP